ncbi:hypothetical protein GCM10010193_08950 [Kitasatospora atroaurantiaca]
MIRTVERQSAPALGDLRAMGERDTVVIVPGAETRPDWARYAEAIGAAVGRGAEARWSRG